MISITWAQATKWSSWCWQSDDVLMILWQIFLICGFSFLNLKIIIDEMIHQISMVNMKINTNQNWYRKCWKSHQNQRHVNAYSFLTEKWRVKFRDELTVSNHKKRWFLSKLRIFFGRDAKRKLLLERFSFFSIKNLTWLEEPRSVFVTCKN